MRSRTLDRLLIYHSDSKVYEEILSKKLRQYSMSLKPNLSLRRVSCGDWRMWSSPLMFLALTFQRRSVKSSLEIIRGGWKENPWSVWSTGIKVTKFINSKFGNTLALWKSLPASLFPPGQRPKGGNVSFPLWKRGIEGDFMVILLISLAFEIHFSKG